MDMRNQAYISEDQLDACDKFNHQYMNYPPARRHLSPSKAVSHTLLPESKENKQKIDANPMGSLYRVWKEGTTKGKGKCEICGSAHNTKECGWMKKFGG
jgi:hypothetical protein